VPRAISFVNAILPWYGVDTNNMAAEDDEATRRFLHAARYGSMTDLDSIDLDSVDDPMDERKNMLSGFRAVFVFFGSLVGISILAVWQFSPVLFPLCFF
jgi:hypothetical protein